MKDLKIQVKLKKIGSKNRSIILTRIFERVDDGRWRWYRGAQSNGQWSWQARRGWPTGQHGQSTCWGDGLGGWSPPSDPPSPSTLHS